MNNFNDYYNYLNNNYNDMNFLADPNSMIYDMNYQALYPNEKVAMKVTFVKGNINGKLVINSIEGKPEYEANYKNGLFEGERTEYYSNGKVYKKENLKNGDFYF